MRFKIENGPILGCINSRDCLVFHIRCFAKFAESKHNLGASAPLWFASRRCIAGASSHGTQVREGRPRKSGNAEHIL